MARITLIRLTAGALTAAALAFGCAASAASARDAYVANYGSSNVTVIDTDTNTAIGTLTVDPNPSGVAITPDGKTAYVVSASGTVSRIKTSTNQVVGEPIDVGDNPVGIAITPNGRNAVVANNVASTVSVIDTKTHKAKPEVPVTGAGALYSVAIRPDGDRAYGMSYSTDQIFPIKPETGAADGSPTGVGQNPSFMAFTPSGTGYVANSIDGNVSVINPAGSVVGSPIPVVTDPLGVAVSPSGARVYVSNNSNVGSVSVIDTSTNAVVGSPVPVGDHPRGLTVDPGGDRVYVTNSGVGTTPGSVSVIDTASNATVGSPIEVGVFPKSVAIVPDQPPKAQFDVNLRGDPHTMTTFDAGFSADPDGTVARYDWDYGDGALGPDAGSVPSHVYDSPGRYKVTVTETDDEGCSTTVVYTGQTASCGGSDAAVAEKTVKISYPKVKLKCKRSSRGKCRVEATALTKRSGGEKASRRAKTKIKPGKSKQVQLPIKPDFSAEYAFKENTFVQVRTEAGGKTSTTVEKLPLIR